MTSKKEYKTIDEYIDSFPKNIQSTLAELRQAIREAAPEATETISYQMPTFKLNGSLVHFAAHKSNIGFYPTPSAIEEFNENLASFTTSKGAVQFPLDKPLPIALIKEMVRFRVKENLKKRK